MFHSRFFLSFYAYVHSRMYQCTLLAPFPLVSIFRTGKGCSIFSEKLCVEDGRTNAMQVKPLITCSYGWKRTLALYQDRIDVDGTCYALDDLVHVRSIYRTVLNIPSVRLELRFRKKDVVLRGIAAIEDVMRIVEYLDTYCADTKHVTSRLRWSRTRTDMARSQPLATPALPASATTDALSAISNPRGTLPKTLHEAGGFDHRDMQEYAQAVTAPIEAPVWLRDLELHVLYTRQQQRTQANRSLRKYGFDVQQRVQDGEVNTLPSVAVPLRLLPQEVAHYCVESTLCCETPVATGEQTPRFTYAPTDQGRLILTSTRLIYLGKRGQIVLEYGRLTHVSRLRNAIVFAADSWSQRHVFEVSRPLECAMYLDNVLRQFQYHAAQTQVQNTPQIPHEPVAQHATTHARYAHHTYTAPQPRYAAASRQATTMRSIRPAIELADIETLPLSLLKRAETELETVE